MSVFQSFRGWPWVAALVWTLFLASSLFNNLEEHRQSVLSFAKSEADVLIKHMKAARDWNASHGGLYAETSERTPPNPHLIGLVKERNIETASGRKLTLVNPAYMTRLINDYFNETDKRIAHITSLNPIRPENVADEWEKRALIAFERGTTEVSEITELNGKPYMRLMRPLVTKTSCLKCHAAQGYKVGDIRGGITASVPFVQHAAYLEKLNRDDAITYAGIWVLGLLGIFFGYKRLSKGEQDLQQAEEDIHILSSSVEQASEGILITDREGIIKYANPAFTRLSGYSKAEVVGKRPSLFKSDLHDSRYYEKMWADISSGKPWQDRIVNLKKDGSSYPAMLSIAPIKNREGEITHYVGSQQDLREYEHLEEQFHQAQKMEAIGTLVGGIAHDFNNTLAGITGNLYLAKKSISDSPKTVQRLETIEALSYGTAAMIQQLLAFVRKDVKTFHPLTISSFIKETVKMHRVSIPENIRLICNVRDTDAQVKGDINQLQQVIMNLLNNARDAVEASEDPTITIELNVFEADSRFLNKHPDLTSGSFATISVSDNGCGIKQGNIEHIFDPFFSTKDVGKGTGLGLSMAIGAIHSHNGVIEVDTKVGCGTTMKIYLPLIHADDEKAEVVFDQDVVLGNGETILLVDDESTVVETGKAVLKSLGYKVMSASDGLEATATYREHQDRIDLLLMDVVMPNMSGVAAAEEIRKISPQAKIIFVTGYDRTSTLNGANSIAHEVVIAKPYTTSEISRLIRKILEAS